MLTEPKTLTPEQISELKLSFKRCSEETFHAILRYRQEGDASVIPQVVHGIIGRYMPPESLERFNKSNDDSRISEDLGIDSLTMLEIVLSIEEALDMRIQDTEVRNIRTLGDVNRFLAAKISGEPIASEEIALGASKKFTRDIILVTLPQQLPFMFVDEAELEGDVVRAKYTIRGDEYFLEGHFKGNPVFPASIVFEALGQVGCLWVLECAAARSGAPVKTNEILFASLDGAHFYRKAKPGDVLEMQVTLTKLRAPLAIFEGVVSVGGQRVAKIERLVLAFGELPAEGSEATA